MWGDRGLPTKKPLPASYCKRLFRLLIKIRKLFDLLGCEVFLRNLYLG